MAARLTDKQKKKIIADYVQLGSYNAVSKINGVSATTVKNIVLKSADFVEKTRTPPIFWPTWRADESKFATL